MYMNEIMISISGTIKIPSIYQLIFKLESHGRREKCLRAVSERVKSQLTMDALAGAGGTVITVPTQLNSVIFLICLFISKYYIIL